MSELHHRPDLPDSAFAIPPTDEHPGKLPLTDDAGHQDASHVRNAEARLNQVQGVSEAEKSVAGPRIAHAAEKTGVHLAREDDQD